MGGSAIGAGRGAWVAWAWRAHAHEGLGGVGGGGGGRRSGRTPCIIHDAFDSPGCTRAERATTGRALTASAGDEWSVTQSISHSLPAIVSASRCRRTCRARSGSA